MNRLPLFARIIAGPIIVIGVTLLGTAYKVQDPPGGPIPDVPSPYGGCSDCSMTARKIAWSLDNLPDQWKLDTVGATRSCRDRDRNSGDIYWLKRGDVYLWIANERYGLRISLSERDMFDLRGWSPSSDGPDGDLIWKAVTCWLTAHRSSFDRCDLAPEDIKP